MKYWHMCFGPVIQLWDR